MDAIVKLTKEIKLLWRAVKRLQITGFQRPTWLTTPLTSVAWDGDSYSTTAKTLIDMSAVFGVPANIKSVYIKTVTRDSGSAAGDLALILGPTNAAGVGLFNRCSGKTNDALEEEAMIVPCDANGDIYYQIIASGAGNMDVWIQVWAYWL